MPKPNQPALENILLRNLTAAKGGDEEAIEWVCDALRQVGERDAQLVPLLRSIIAIDDQVLKTYGANALANLKVSALPAVPDLIAMAKDGNGTPRQAAICSLGRIPGRASLECLVRLYVEGDIRLVKEWVGPALKGHGAAMEPYLDRLSTRRPRVDRRLHRRRRMVRAEPDERRQLPRRRDELDLVRMDFDRSTGSFLSPKWERRGSFEDLLQELGGNRGP